MKQSNNQLIVRSCNIWSFTRIQREPADVVAAQRGASSDKRLCVRTAGEMAFSWIYSTIRCLKYEVGKCASFLLASVGAFTIVDITVETTL